MGKFHSFIIQTRSIQSYRMLPNFYVSIHNYSQQILRQCIFNFRFLVVQVVQESKMEHGRSLLQEKHSIASDLLQQAFSMLELALFIPLVFSGFGGCSRETDNYNSRRPTRHKTTPNSAPFVATNSQTKKRHF